jgi:hypothetical protein
VKLSQHASDHKRKYRGMPRPCHLWTDVNDLARLWPSTCYLELEDVRFLGQWLSSEVVEPSPTNRIMNRTGGEALIKSCRGILALARCMG